jgi:hypothetical protein
MCCNLTVFKVFCTQALCYTEEDEDGEVSKGCAYRIIHANCCTKYKTSADDDKGAYEVTLPPVEDLNFRTACCCQYCGFTCKPEHRPLGITNELAACCCRTREGCQLMTGSASKRGCNLMTCVLNCLTCEEPSIDDEFIVLEQSCGGVGCCCIEQGCSAKSSCCPKPLVCIGSQGQTCCLYGRTAFPCNDTTPMELGCCGIMCVDKKEQIMSAEAAIREQKAAQASNTIEATIVTKGGSPSEQMER